MILCYDHSILDRAEKNVGSIVKDVEGLQVKELKREVKELERLVERLKEYDLAKKA